MFRSILRVALVVMTTSLLAACSSSPVAPAQKAPAAQAHPTLDDGIVADTVCRGGYIGSSGRTC
jgi:hypothetical protein